MTQGPIVTLEDGTKVISVDNQVCKLKASAYEDYWVEPPEGYTVCRLIEGKPCRCPNATTTSTGSCGCAGKEPADTHPLILVRK